jgi:cellobiose-specific phosphotransferase system component IIA
MARQAGRSITTSFTYVFAQDNCMTDPQPADIISKMYNGHSSG